MTATEVERVLAWFREPRYSVVDLQRAYAQGANAVFEDEQDPIPDGPVFEEPEPVYVEPVKTPAPDDIPEGEQHD